MFKKSPESQIADYMKNPDKTPQPDLQKLVDYAEKKIKSIDEDRTIDNEKGKAFIQEADYLKREDLKAFIERARQDKDIITQHTQENLSAAKLDQIMGNDLDTLGFSDNKALSLVQEALGITSKVNTQELIVKLKEYQTERNIKTTGQIDIQTITEIKASILVGEFEKGSFKNGISKAKQEEIKLVLDNHENIISQNFNKLIIELGAFRDAHKADTGYDSFVHYLDHYIADTEQRKAQFLTPEQKRELNSNNGKILGKGGVLSVIDGTITPEEFIENHGDSLKTVGIAALIFSAIFGIPKSIWGEIPGGSNWYTRIPLLLGVGFLGGGELLGAGIDKAKEGLFGKQGEETAHDVTIQATQALSNTTGQNHVASVEAVAQMHASVNEGETDNEIIRKNTILSDIFIADLGNKKIEEIDSITTASGLELTTQNRQRLIDLGINDADVSKFITQKLANKTSDKTKTINDILLDESIAITNTPDVSAQEQTEVQTLVGYQETPSSSTILGNGPSHTARETLVDQEKMNVFTQETLAKYKSPKLKLVMALGQIWIDGAQKAKQEQWGMMGLNNDKEIIQGGIDGVTEEMNELIQIINDKNRPITEIDTVIGRIFTKIYRVEKEGEDILDDIEDIHSLFHDVNNENYEQKLSTLLELSAGGAMTDGNTQKSKEIASNIILNRHFSNAKHTISNISDIDSLDIYTFTELGLSKADAEDLIADVKNTYTKTHSATSKHRETLVQRYRQQNPNSNLNITDEVNKIIDQTALIQSKEALNTLFVEKAVHNISENDHIVDAFKELNSWEQILSDFTGEYGLMIATSLIPVGAGIAIVGGIAKGASMMWKGKQLADMGMKMKLATNSAKGVGFYQGMNLTNNALHQDEFSTKILEGWDDKKEIIKNALFFNVMGIASKYASAGKISNTTALAAEITAFTGIDIGAEFVSGEEITLEQLGNSLLTGTLLSAITRGTGKVSSIGLGVPILPNLKQATNVPNLKQATFTRTPTPYRHKTLKNTDGTAKQYIEKADGVLYNMNNHKSTVNKSNLQQQVKFTTTPKTNSNAPTNNINKSSKIGDKLQSTKELLKNTEFKSGFQAAKTGWERIKVVNGKLDIAHMGKWLEKTPWLKKFFANDKIKSTSKGAGFIFAGSLSADELGAIGQSYEDNNLMSLDTLGNLGAIAGNFFAMHKLGIISSTVLHKSLEYFGIKEDGFLDQII